MYIISLYIIVFTTILVYLKPQNKANLFYSRRVGSRPAGYYKVKDTVDNDPDLELLKNPARTQLFNAIN